MVQDSFQKWPEIKVLCQNWKFAAQNDWCSLTFDVYYILKTPTEKIPNLICVCVLSQIPICNVVWSIGFRMISIFVFSLYFHILYSGHIWLCVIFRFLWPRRLWTSLSFCSGHNISENCQMKMILVIESLGRLYDKNKPSLLLGPHWLDRRPSQSKRN